MLSFSHKMSLICRFNDKLNYYMRGGRNMPCALNNFTKHNESRKCIRSQNVKVNG